MTLDQLRALVSVHRAGSLAAAARSTSMSRSTLSRRIEELEADLGTTLLHREPTGTTLSRAGEELAARGRRLLQDVDALARGVRDNIEVRGTLRLAYPSGMHPTVGVTAARVMLETFPDLDLVATPDTTRLDPSRVDVAIHIGDRPPPGPFVARSIARVPVRLLASGAWIEAHPLSGPADLADHTLLAWTSDGGPVSALPLTDGGFLSVSPRVTTPDLHALHHAARAGLGVVWAVAGGLPEAEGVEQLTPVLADQVGTEVPVWVLTLATERDVPRVQEAIRSMVRLLSLSATAR